VSDEKTAMESTYDQQQSKITQMQGEIAKTKPVVEKMVLENKELNEKIKRASHMLAKARERHRQTENVPADARYPATLLEMDVELRMTKSTVETAIAELTKLAEANRDIEPRLRLGLTQVGLTLKQLGPTPLAQQPKSPTIVTPTSSGRSSGSYRSGGSAGSRGSVHSSGSAGSRGSKTSAPK
jgi:uncharacterized membrane protein YgcG